ncbi:unnamed protein product [Penicillium nalgiovense]|nr:unnamed protein product [Penicillium nalgiovense]CAG8068025.1 unnamed protein product [Penicillium nalgiovense]CAG8070657.1 unnamed protein product [Penicillium nalgiovense]CAG8074643.1 unnamed protein product [Penicillium nalgiovense]CAG8076076.1 unnamed protein product [Penicillium nalgiovense]
MTANNGIVSCLCRLSLHEASDLDVILLGHSLGGILAADVALLLAASSTPSKDENGLKHRILGLVNFDVPFLGLHPHVISTGIQGLLHRKEDDVAAVRPDLWQDGQGAYAAVIHDSLFDPPFANDIHLIQRDRIEGMMHFVQKHNHNLLRSTYERALSSYRFVGCLHNYKQLRRRHRQLARLETATENTNGRVRFVNYYTLSAGAKRKVKQEGGGGGSALGDLQYLPTNDNSSIREDANHVVLSSPSKQYKFVLLPSSHWKTGDNSHWTPVSMGMMDEVTAHQSMFRSQGGKSQHYDRLVGEVVSQIGTWVQDDLTQRLLTDT